MELPPGTNAVEKSYPISLQEAKEIEAEAERNAAIFDALLDYEDDVIYDEQRDFISLAYLAIICAPHAKPLVKGSQKGKDEASSLFRKLNKALNAGGHKEWMNVWRICSFLQIREQELKSAYGHAASWKARAQDASILRFGEGCSLQVPLDLQQNEDLRAFMLEDYAAAMDELQRKRKAANEEDPEEQPDEVSERDPEESPEELMQKPSLEDRKTRTQDIGARDQGDETAQETPNNGVRKTKQYGPERNKSDGAQR